MWKVFLTSLTSRFSSHLSNCSISNTEMSKLPGKRCHRRVQKRLCRFVQQESSSSIMANCSCFPILDIDILLDVVLATAFKVEGRDQTRDDSSLDIVGHLDL